MKYPIHYSDLERADLTAAAKRLYDALRGAGHPPSEAMHTLVQICEETSEAPQGNGMRLPTLRYSRRRAAKRIARTMLAQGRTDDEVQRETGISYRQIRRLKNELDEEVEPEAAQAEPA